MDGTSPSGPAPPAIDASAFLEQALAVLALRLKHEVALMRALRGEARQEAFLGLFLTEGDAQAMLDELSGRIGLEAGLESLAEIDRIEAELRRIRSGDPELIWNRLARAFRLTAPELDLLLHAAAPALDPRFGRVYGFLNDDMGRRHLTLPLAQRLLDGHGLDLLALRRCLSPEAPLRHRGLLRVTEAGTLSDAALTVPDDLIDLLLGDRTDPLHGAPADELRGLDPGPGEAGLLVLVGRDCGGAALRAASEGPLLRIEAARVAHLDEAALGELLRTLLRRAHLSGRLPYLAGFGTASLALRLRIARLVDAPCVLDAPRRGLWAEAGLEVPETEAAPLSTAEEARLFAGAPILAGRDRVPLLDRLRLADRYEGAPEGLGPALRARAARGMDGVAEPVDSAFGFEDLVLAPPALDQLRSFVSWRRQAPRILRDWGMGAVFNRRPGSVALFRGPPGTGKTMAASVVANAMGAPLYRVDLAGLISKYIGETEKNLDRLFTAADATDVVLFFDEADALFGKRAEVSDAHDRYANVETSYLLQRIEAQSGPVILATNLQDNIDPAFLRRIDMVVDFPAPGRADRLRLWERLHATGAPVAPDLDLPFLAETFDLTGGEIRNVILAAAHAACDSGCIGMGEVLRALAQELRKLGRPLRKQLFGPHYHHLRDLPG